MRAFQFGWTVLAVVPCLALATPTVDVSTINCSGTQSPAFADVLSLTCTGDFSLSGGSLAADAKIVLSSDGALSLDNLSITAPRVELVAGGSLSIGAGVSIVTDSFSGVVNGGTPPAINISTGATITIGSGGTPGPIDLGTISIGPGGGIPVGGGGSISLLVPEPGSFALLLAGLLALAGVLHAGGRRGQRPIAGTVQAQRAWRARPP